MIRSGRFVRSGKQLLVVTKHLASMEMLTHMYICGNRQIGRPLENSFGYFERLCLAKGLKKVFSKMLCVYSQIY